jgi:hypothetical protein
MFHEAYISVDEYALFDEKIGFCNDGSVRVLSKTFPVNPKTVGQFTGLLDRHGKEIYEEDIITNLYGDIGVIIWKERITSFVCSLNLVSFNSVNWDKCVIIGNIHDNPELIHDQKAEVEHD